MNRNALEKIFQNELEKILNLLEFSKNSSNSILGLFKEEKIKRIIEAIPRDECQTTKTQFLQKNILKVISEVPYHFHALEKKISLWEKEDSCNDKISLKEIWQTNPSMLIKNNLDTVKKAASTYHSHQKIDNEQLFADLLSLGYEILFLTAQKVFENPKIDFNRTLHRQLRQKMLALKSNNHPIPKTLRTKMNKLTQLRSQSAISREALLGHKPLEHISEFNQETIQELLHLEKLWGPGGGEAEEFDDNLILTSSTPPVCEQLQVLQESESIKKSLNLLPALQKQLLTNIYFKNMSLRETGVVMNLSLSQTKKIHKKALINLKSQLE